MAFLSSRNGITTLTVLTALIHLGLGIVQIGNTFGQLFILNAIGYLVLLYATFWTPAFLQGQKDLIRWVFIGFTAVTIVLFFVFNCADAFRAIPGLVTKLIEILLLVGLWRSK